MVRAPQARDADSEFLFVPIELAIDFRRNLHFAGIRQGLLPISFCGEVTGSAYWEMEGIAWSEFTIGICTPSQNGTFRVEVGTTVVPEGQRDGG